MLSRTTMGPWVPLRSLLYSNLIIHRVKGSARITHLGSRVQPSQTVKEMDTRFVEQKGKVTHTHCELTILGELGATQGHRSCCVHIDYCCASLGT